MSEKMSTSDEWEARLDAVDPNGKFSNEQLLGALQTFVQEKVVIKSAELKQALAAFAQSAHGGPPTDDDKFEFLLGAIASIAIQLEMQK